MGRTSKNIKLRIPEKPRKIKGFRSGSYRVATTISSQARYDHFDTPPWEIYSVFGTDNMISSQARYDHFDTAPYHSCAGVPEDALLNAFYRRF